MTKLTVLYDQTCGFCVRCRRWLQGQAKLLEMEFVPLQSGAVGERFPGLEGPERPDELVVVSDEGGVYRGPDAFIMCLYALEAYREWSLRLAEPRLRPLARRAFEWLSRHRKGLSRKLRLAPEEDLVRAFERVTPAAYALPPSAPCPACRRPVSLAMGRCPHCGALVRPPAPAGQPR